LSLIEKKLKIAILNRIFSPTGGGAERYSIALVEQLAGKHDIHVFAQQIAHADPRVTYHQISAPVTRSRWLNQIWYSIATWRATRCGFDVVHSHESISHGQVQTVHVLPVKHSLFAGRKGARLALRLIKVALSPRLLAYLVMEHLRFGSRGSRWIIATSQVLAAVIKNSYPGCKLSVVAPGVTLPDKHLDRRVAREILGLPAEGRMVAFVANDYKKKGLFTLVSAISGLPEDVGVAVVGNPSQSGRFQQQADELGVGSRIHFLGHLNDISPLYDAVDVLAHPTTEDTFAMVVLEAMAYGIPVVVSDAPYCGISGLLTDGVNALILPSPDDVFHLAQLLSSVLENPATRQVLSAGALLFAAQSSWTSIAQRQEEIYLYVADATPCMSEHRH
jgi:glycosyltransferase involved in cell wall biosynthesis